MIARILLLALVLLASACANGHRTISVRHDDLTAATQAAVDAWNAKLSRQCPNVSITLVDGEADMSVRWGGPAPERPTALAYEQEGAIVVNREQAKYWDERAVGALMHEIGHALGAEHSDDRADVMFPKAYPGVPELTTADVHQVCSQFDGVP